eukprot:TRINITY_DN9480_c0_g1_i1.p1 TRINITY_DN9480_c0_g1~~TRINITY_DN9480_c0_g1_i1.p1  ORF type:complete len:555 (+),score=66.37 TRINITY_DN9480_c0_g1_i1:922-2586(+)
MMGSSGSSSNLQCFSEVGPPAVSVGQLHRTLGFCEGCVDLHMAVAGCITGEGSVKEAYVMKRTSGLLNLISQRDGFVNSKEEAEKAWAKADKKEDARPTIRPTWCGSRVDAIEFYDHNIKDLERQIEIARSKLHREKLLEGGVNTSAGFVTFHNVRDAELARHLWYSYHNREWLVSYPPDPAFVDWKSIAERKTCARLWAFVGYIVTASIYFLFLPVTLGITNLSYAVDMGTWQPIWASFAPTLGLLLFISLLPSVLLLIFQTFFQHQAERCAQHQMQGWYYWFMVFFVVLVTAIGSDFREFVKQCVETPVSVAPLVASKLPYATHFYMNYLIVQWTAHTLHACRPSQLCQYLAWGYWKGTSVEDCRKLSEPEDQGYFGLGSRSARWTINLTIAIVFSTLSPIITIFALVDFAVCRLFSTYLLVFAETKKYDLGGAFWVTKLEHALIGLIVYCVLMIGVLAARSPAPPGSHFIPVPVLIASAALAYALWVYYRFDSDIAYKGLPFPEAAAMFQGKAEARADTGQRYVQAELFESEDEPLHAHREKSARSQGGVV